MLVVLVLVAACSSPAPSPPAATAFLKQNAAQSSETMASIRQVDDHPLYEMTFQGGYDPAGALPQDLTAIQPWGCSLFFASGDPAHPVFARNFDWDHNPAMVVRSDPPDGHASLSVVDASYVLEPSERNFTDPAIKAKLRYTVLLPFDGFNEKGLAVGMAAVPEGEAPPGMPRVSSLRIMRLMLDRAATVDEAVAIMRSYTVDFAGGPPVHYMVADASGRSAVLELLDGKVSVLPGKGPWNLAVNFLLTGAGEKTKQDDWRWRTASASLSSANGTLAWQPAMRLLERIAQSHTQWSAVYDLKGGVLRLTTSKRFGTVHTFSITKSR